MANTPPFPQLGPVYYEEPHRAVLSRMEAFYAEAVTINQSFWSEADTDLRFVLNDQSLWNDLYGNLPANRRRQFTFNRILRIVNMIDGYQRRNRKSTIVVPIENADEQTADQFTKLMMWLDQAEGISETISDSFRNGTLISGMNLLHVWLDYRNDPISGNIKVSNCNYNSFLIDPFFRKQDLSDCNALWKRSYLTKRECIALLPEHTEAILGLSGGTYSGSGNDAKFQFMPESYNATMKNLLTYDEFYYTTTRAQKLLVDRETGETFEWKSNDKDALKMFLQLYPQITVLDQEVPTVNVAIVVEGRCFYDGRNPLGTDNYPFVPVIGYFNPQSPYYPWRIQGVVRGLRDAQYLYNRRRVIELDILESQITSGFKYKENALVNPSDVFMAGQGKGLALKEEAQMSDVEQIPAPQIPPSMIQLSELLAREVQEISGVNEELLGSAVDDKAGILSMLRQGAGLTTLQILFDQLDYSQKLLGKVIIDVVQANFTPGKVKRILNEEPSPQFYNRTFGRYDAGVEEGFNTTTQRQMQFAQLLQLKELGVLIPDETLIEAATLQDKNKLIEAIKQNQQAAQQQAQEQAQVQQNLMAAQTQLAQAKASADQGLAVERVSRVQENQALAVERRAEAAKDDDLALLHKVKALKELQDMDLNYLQQLVALSESLKNTNISIDSEQEPVADLQG